MATLEISILVSLTSLLIITLVSRMPADIPMEQTLVEALALGDVTTVAVTSLSLLILPLPPAIVVLACLLNLM